jgi:hypothetical protein
MNSSIRLDKAAAAAHKYQMVKLGYVDQDAGTNSLTKHKGIDSMIEDKIQLAILQGDFDNLPTAGTNNPTKVEYQNPLVDRTTDMAYEILRKNGIKPEWIELQQSMNQLKEDLRVRLRAEWSRHCIDQHTERVQLTGKESSAAGKEDGDASVPAFRMPAGASCQEFASRVLVKFAHDERVCNSKVDSYNLNVPSHVLTRGRVILTLEVDKVVREVTFGSEDEARAVRAECTAAARQMEHHRYAASLDMAARGQDKNAAPVSKGPGYRYQRTVHTSNAGRSSQSSTGASGYGTMYYSNGHGHSHGHSHGNRSLLTNYTTSSGSGSSGNGDLVMRSLMMPVDLLANSLMRAMDRFSF